MPKYQNIISRLLSLAIFIGCVVLSPALAQNQAVIDSLNLRLKTATDQQRFELLQRLFREYNQNDFNTALRYAEDAYKLANALGDSSKIVEGGRMMAFSLMDLGRNEEAIKILNRSLKIAYRNIDRYPDIKPKIKYLLNNTGIAYMYRGNYDSSLSYHFESLAIRDEEGDKKSLGTALNNIGLVFFKLKSFEQALQYYQRSLDLKNELGDKSDLDKILINIGLCYNSLGDANQAIKSFNKAIASCAPDCGETQRKEVYFGLANAYNVLKKIDSAEVNYKRSIAIAKNQSDKQYWMENLVGLMQIENERKNYLMGIRYLDEALQFESQLQLPEPLISLYTQAAKIYLLNDDYKQSAFYQGKYIKLKDSIISGDLIKNLAKIQATFEERENLKTISEKNRVLQLQNELISRQKTQYLFVVVILILSTGLALVLIWANRKQRIQSVALNQAKQMIGVQNEKLKEINNSLDKQIEEKTEDLIKTNRALKEVNNEMDHFIYRTSHDIRGPLVTLKGICNVALLDVKDPVAIDYFHKLNHTSEKLNLILTRLLMVNRISRWELAPEEINFIGLIESIIRLDYPGGIPNNISFEYRVDADVKIYSDFFLLKVIIENLLANSFKFYNTSGRVEPFVKIEISRAADKNILIKVKDNGIGIVTDDLSHIFQLFNRASERSEIGGVGLYLCKLAAIRLGGFIELTDSSPS
ncbi:MAG: tetratricopeptide repeat-containing sensor histidine kinase, partial [Cyclobacteriaceae bacterium]|nr:tetratricopeptide repeat-containing sensor histidine kinase [Cyclobacteriaceae bacterium]